MTLTCHGFQMNVGPVGRPPYPNVVDWFFLYSCRNVLNEAEGKAIFITRPLNRAPLLLSLLSKDISLRLRISSYDKSNRRIFLQSFDVPRFIDTVDI